MSLVQISVFRRQFDHLTRTHELSSQGLVTRLRVPDLSFLLWSIAQIQCHIDGVDIKLSSGPLPCFETPSFGLPFGQAQRDPLWVFLFSLPSPLAGDPLQKHA